MKPVKNIVELFYSKNLRLHLSNEAEVSFDRWGSYKKDLYIAISSKKPISVSMG